MKFEQLRNGSIQAFKIDLKKNRLKIVRASDSGKSSDSVTDLAQGKKALIAINGGFFTENWRSLGLLISDGKKLNPLRRADWGVLSITQSGQAKLVHTRDWQSTKNTDFAIQCGPRLVVDGKVLSLKKQSARRTAIGILPGGRSLILIVANTPVGLLELAGMLKKRFGCSYAINLDGGSSTQLWSKFAKTKSVGGFPVTNIVTVVPRP